MSEGVGVTLTVSGRAVRATMHRRGDGFWTCCPTAWPEVQATAKDATTARRDVEKRLVPKLAGRTTAEPERG